LPGGKFFKRYDAAQLRRDLSQIGAQRSCVDVTHCTHGREFTFASAIDKRAGAHRLTQSAIAMKEHAMMLGLSPHAATLLEGVTAMVRDEIAPLDAEYFEQVEIGDRWHSTRRAKPKFWRG